MKPNIKTEAAIESIYSLFVRSEEKERSLGETAVYLLFIASAVFSIWQVAQQPVTLPTGLEFRSSTPVAQAVVAPERGV